MSQKTVAYAAPSKKNLIFEGKQQPSIQTLAHYVSFRFHSDLKKNRISSLT